MRAPRLLVPVAALGSAPREFFDGLRAQLAAGGRLVTLFGRRGDAPDEVVLTAVVLGVVGLEATRTVVSREHGYHALTREIPAAHVFERELHEQLGLRLLDHPWLKPVRSSGGGLGLGDAHPFYELAGKEVHEVAVGPVHAGVIEPGHFRFMCLGEQVHHLEIQLGYQHRGVEGLLLEGDPRRLAPLVETIAGDSSIAHAWAYCDAIEGLGDAEVMPEVEISRGIGLELERIAMHLSGLAGLAGDIAFLPGASTYGRLRTTAINTSMLLCGSRFGRGWLRPGGTRAVLDEVRAAALRSNLALLERDVAIINDHVKAARSVRHRLEGVGELTREQALSLGVVGMSARASGVELDLRTALPGGLHARLPIAMVVEPGGDCWARAVVRMREIEVSLRWLKEVAVSELPAERSSAPVAGLAPDMLAVAVREGWRGEVVHCLETDASGRLRHYKVHDPSQRNWFGLAMAVRANGISDFPICNKSFDLSYCGNDL